MSDPNEEKNVEELLSQLQGIFGKLSKADEEEARPNPPKPPPEPVAEPAPSVAKPAPSIVEPSSAAAESSLSVTEPLSPVAEPIFPKLETSRPEIVIAEPAPLPREDPFSLQPPPIPEPIPEPVPEPVPQPLPVPTPDPVVEVSSAPVMPMPEQPQVYDASTIGCAIFYPLMREKEAKVLAQKIETMTPKFTKLAFKLKVGFILSYDPRSDWRDTAIARARENNIRAFFLLSDRVLDESKRRALQSELDGHLIYFQEVPILSLEKKAFFTDVLLGMVFFFDTIKPKSPGE